jgi:hypothetical protein
MSQKAGRCSPPSEMFALWPSLTKFDGAYLPASSLRDILAMRMLTHNSKPSSCKSFRLRFVSSCTHSSEDVARYQISKIWRKTRCTRPLWNPPTLTGRLFIQYPLPTMSSAFPSFLEHTQGSLRNLYIGGVFESSYDQNAMYELCPRLETLTLVHAKTMPQTTLAGTSRNNPCVPTFVT